jgi:hypothetical protein
VPKKYRQLDNITRAPEVKKFKLDSDLSRIALTGVEVERIAAIVPCLSKSNALDGMFTMGRLADLPF